MGVETERIDDAEKAGATQDLLRDTVELTLNVVVDVRLYILFGHGRLLD